MESDISEVSRERSLEVMLSSTHLIAQTHASDDGDSDDSAEPELTLRRVQDSKLLSSRVTVHLV